MLMPGVWAGSASGKWSAPGSWLACPSWPAQTAAVDGQPSIDLLRRLACHDDLCCLWSEAGLLAQWGVAPLALRGLDDLPEIPGRLHEPATSHWPEGLHGGALLQLDYEFPVGAWAADSATGPETRGWGWPLRQGCRLHADGRRHCFGDDPRAVEAACLAPPVELPPVRLLGDLTPAWDEAGHCRRVEHIRERIAAGDCYQVNLTLPFSGRLTPAPHLDLAVFAALVGASPAGFSCLLRTPRGSIISHSPECFLVSDGRICRSAPIKGTRARRAGEEEERRAELQAAVKDNAELAMIVDLVRNDLGRVARAGGVRLERGPHVVDLDYVHHLLAVVAAELRPGCGIADLLRAAFPAGSITGAPKIAAMRVISELEIGPRGPYCGSFGWIGQDPAGAQCSLSVAIRSMVLAADGALRAQVGGGIVADSDGAAEWREALDKLAGMARALGAGR
jgi:isochorismate synthase EntC